MTCLPTCVPYGGATVSGIAHDSNCPDQHAASTSSCGVDHGSGAGTAAAYTVQVVPGHQPPLFQISVGPPHCATCRCTS